MGRYVPETLSEQEAMLKQIGLEKIDDLYAMVPEEARLQDLHIPSLLRPARPQERYLPVRTRFRRARPS